LKTPFSSLLAATHIKNRSSPAHIESFSLFLALYY
jgi:hypothetical protein